MVHTADWHLTRGFCSMNPTRSIDCLFSLDGMLAHRRLLPTFCIVGGTHAFILLSGEKHCESKVCCPKTQHNWTPARARTRTAQSGVQRALTIRPPLLPSFVRIISNSRDLLCYSPDWQTWITHICTIHSPSHVFYKVMCSTRSSMIILLDLYVYV